MTYGTSTKLSTEDEPSLKPQNVEKEQIKIQKIMETLKDVEEDIALISKLISDEELLVAQFFESLQKKMHPLTPSIAVSAAVLPIKIREGTQAHINSTGHLSLTYEDGQQRLMDLSEIENRDLMVAVIKDIMPKFKDLSSQLAAKKPKKPSHIQETSTLQHPTSEPPVAINVDASTVLADSVHKEETEEAAKAGVTNPSVERNAKIAEIMAETLEYLEILGNEVFERSPVSRYFDDWMVNLRQVILSFESSSAIGPDEAFTEECNQIFGNIENELAKRLASEADIEVSARSLVESRYLLKEIDDGYATQSKELVVKGKDAIDYLTRNVKQLEKELGEVAKIKTSYRHPLQKRAKEQKQAELTQKLNAAKKRLALVVGTSSVGQEKVEEINAEYAAQTKDLTDKRKAALDFLTKEVCAIEAELAQIEKIKTINPIKKMTKEQRRFEVTEKLVAAKDRLKIAEQNSNAEHERLKTEYEEKKQATLGKMQSLEKNIATKTIDNSAEVRKEATDFLAKAVMTLAHRKTDRPQQALSASSE